MRENRARVEAEQEIRQRSGNEVSDYRQPCISHCSICYLFYRRRSQGRFYIGEWLIFKKRKLFIHERHREAEGKQAPHGEPDAGLDPRTPGSWPEPKVDAQPLSHPGEWLILFVFLLHYPGDDINLSKVLQEVRSPPKLLIREEWGGFLCKSRLMEFEIKALTNSEVKVSFPHVQCK